MEFDISDEQRIFAPSTEQQERIQHVVAELITMLGTLENEMEKAYALITLIYGFDDISTVKVQRTLHDMYEEETRDTYEDIHT